MTTIGLDLGTGFSCVACWENGKAKIIPNKQGKNTTPSIVAFTKDGEMLIGEAAKRQAITNPERTIYEIKRLMGKKFDHPDVQNIMKKVPYKIVKADNGDAWVDVDGKQYSPQQISAFIIGHMKEIAEDYLGKKVEKIVITVPAYFNDSQRQATKDAGQIAGLEVARLVAEPTAACLSYGIDKKDKDLNVVVVDYGSGTADQSYIQLGDGVFEVSATCGDSQLGGSDFDKAIMQYMIEEFKKENSIDLSNDKMALQRLKEAAENAKIELSNSMQTDINLPFITANQDGPKHLTMKLTRAKFEAITDDIINRHISLCSKLLKEAKQDKSTIDEIILVGGTSRIPKIQEELQKFFGKELNKSQNPDESIALGASIQAAVLDGNNSVGDIVLLDVTPLSVGIEVAGGIMAKIIEKNTTIPCKKEQIFSTATDNQPAVTIRVFQGEREIAEHNKLLGNFDLDGIAPAPRGVPQIIVSFDIDNNGILHVSAKDKGTGKKQSIKISNSSGLSKDEIERMIKEAEQFAEEDRKKKELVETKNNAENIVSITKKTLNENSDKLSQSLKDEVEQSIKETEEVMNSDDVENLKKSVEKLQQVSMKIGEELYKASQEQQSSPDDKITDAEFTEV